MNSPQVGIVISTKNRRDSLRRTLQETFKQDYAAMTVLVLDDGSTDRTSEMVREEFPSARLERNEVSRGYIHCRNRAADLLSECEYLVSLDDDSWMLDSGGLRNVARLFGEHPDAALLAFEIFAPYHMPLSPDLERDGAETALFAGCGYAVHRERFIELGRFPEYFDYYAEEADFALRVVDSPWTCRFASSVPVYHAEIPGGRNYSRIVRYSLANTLSMYWTREPLAICLAHSALTLARNLSHMIPKGELGSVIGGIMTFMGRGPTLARERKTVRWRTLKKYRRLQREWSEYFLGRRASPAPRLSVNHLEGIR